LKGSEGASGECCGDERNEAALGGRRQSMFRANAGSESGGGAQEACAVAPAVSSGMKTNWNVEVRRRRLLVMRCSRGPMPGAAMRSGS
jgi:hypothetical protein